MRDGADNRRQRVGFRVSLAASATLALLLAGCGDYDPEPTEPAGGSGGQTSTTEGLNPGAQTAVGGSDSAAMGGGTPVAMGGSGPAAMGGANSGNAAGTGGESSMGGTPTVPMVEADCSDVTPCGGNVVGTWVAAGSCLPVSGMADMTGFGLGCTQAPIAGTLEVSGTWTANADGTFMDQTTTSGDSQIDLPPGCLNVSGTTTTCDRLGGAIQALGYSLVTCVDAASGGGCTCSATAEQTGGLAMLAFGAATSGTYTTADSVLTTTASGNNSYAYCVTGSTLVMTPQSPGRTGTLAGTIVLVKPGS